MMDIARKSDKFDVMEKECKGLVSIFKDFDNGKYRKPDDETGGGRRSKTKSAGGEESKSESKGEVFDETNIPDNYYITHKGAGAKKKFWTEGHDFLFKQALDVLVEYGKTFGKKSYEKYDHTKEVKDDQGNVIGYGTNLNALLMVCVHIIFSVVQLLFILVYTKTIMYLFSLILIEDMR